MALFYNKPVVIDDLVFYVDAGNKRSFNEDDLAYDGAAVNAQTAFVSAGTSSFVVPVGVTSISAVAVGAGGGGNYTICLLYTSPSPRDVEESRMPSSA